MITEETFTQKQGSTAGRVHSYQGCLSDSAVDGLAIGGWAPITVETNLTITGKYRIR